MMVTVVRGSGPGSVAPKSSFLTTDYPLFLYNYSSNSTCMIQLHHHHSESGTHAGPYLGAKGSKSSFSCNHEAKATQLDSGTSKSSTQEGCTSEVSHEWRSRQAGRLLNPQVTWWLLRIVLDAKPETDGMDFSVRELMLNDLGPGQPHCT